MSKSDNTSNLFFRDVYEIATLFFIFLLVLFFSCLGIWQTITEYKSGFASLNWPETKGVIDEAVVDHYSTGGGAYADNAKISYSYNVEGKDYQGFRVGFLYDSSRNPAGLVEKFPPGKTVEVYYEKSDPSNSVLSRGGGSIANLGFRVSFYFVVVLAGLAGSVYFSKLLVNRSNSFIAE